MRYEKPNMELMLLSESDILTISFGLKENENGGTEGADWDEWFEETT